MSVRSLESKLLTKLFSCLHYPAALVPHPHRCRIRPCQGYGGTELYAGGNLPSLGSILPECWVKTFTFLFSCDLPSSLCAYCHRIRTTAFLLKALHRRLSFTRIRAEHLCVHHLIRHLLHAALSKITSTRCSCVGMLLRSGAVLILLALQVSESI